MLENDALQSQMLQTEKDTIDVITFLKKEDAVKDIHVSLHDDCIDKISHHIGIIANISDLIFCAILIQNLHMFYCCHKLCVRMLLITYTQI